MQYVILYLDLYFSHFVHNFQSWSTKFGATNQQTIIIIHNPVHGEVSQPCSRRGVLDTTLCDKVCQLL